MSVVIARLEKMRPAFLPRVFGVTYMQVIYRAVVRCGEERGVSFLRSDADNSLMVLGGNALTFFPFSPSKYFVAERPRSDPLFTDASEWRRGAN